jgi:hypothetical protein
LSISVFTQTREYKLSCFAVAGAASPDTILIRSALQGDIPISSNFGARPQTQSTKAPATATPTPTPKDEIDSESEFSVNRVVAHIFATPPTPQRSSRDVDAQKNTKLESSIFLTGEL